MSEWRPYPRDARYEVSADGRIRSLWFRNGKVTFLRSAPLIMKQNGNWSGHMSVQVGGGRRVAVHRMVLEAFVGPPPANAEACHCNGNPADNRVSNLRWDTKLENERDKLRHGTRPFGERSGTAKLGKEKVMAILSSTEGGSLLARRYGVSKSTISAIRHGRLWPHIQRISP